MSLPKVVSREEWLAARKALLAKEKEATRARDALNADRRRLPMVEITKEYLFEGPDGRLALGDLFDGRRQLIIQHVMFDPSWDDACSSCTAGIDEMSPGLISHLQARETTFALVSRTPLAKIEDYKLRRGWPYAWFSSLGSDFNYDFHVTMDATKTPVQYNYRDADELAAAGMDWILEGSSEQPGMSCFLRDGDRVFHTYSAFARGVDHFGGAYGFLDLTALGRQEEWEEPKGRADDAHAAMPNFAQ
jgi:predicted dithiol-disulfide oxidoreductase (DUF899 family)